MLQRTDNIYETPLCSFFSNNKTVNLQTKIKVQLCFVFVTSKINLESMGQKDICIRVQRREQGVITFNCSSYIPHYLWDFFSVASVTIVLVRLILFIVGMEIRKTNQDSIKFYWILMDSYIHDRLKMELETKSFTILQKKNQHIICFQKMIIFIIYSFSSDVLFP